MFYKSRYSIPPTFHFTFNSEVRQATWMILYSSDTFCLDPALPAIRYVTLDITFILPTHGMVCSKNEGNSCVLF